MITRIRRVFISMAVIIALTVSYIPAQVAEANINSCSAQVYQHTVTQDSNTDFQLQITNTSGNSIKWIKITRPSENFTNINGNISYAPWTGDSDQVSSTFSGGTIAPGSSLDHIFEGAYVTSAAPAANWLVQVSDNSDGSSPTACSGDLGTAITYPPPTIYNIAVTNIASSGVVITWDSDVASTSRVNYGLDDSYGSSSPEDSTPVSNHSVKLSGLKANTGYHFQVVSTTPGGGTTTSGDSTFLTAIEQAPITKIVSLPGLAIQVTNPSDKTPPTISLTSKLAKVLKSAPTINGVAADNLSVVRVEYSTDGGRNWLPVDSAPDLGGKQVSFSFMPTNLDDGNYNVLARAIDAGGNVAATSPLSIIIDRLPPLVGGNIISIGPQILQPNTNGVLTTIVGVDQKITTSAVGGAITINLVANRTDTRAKVKNFALTRDIDTGLWAGILSFEEPGTYSLVANSVDGAGNKTTKTINTVYVSAPGQVLEQIGKQPMAAEVTAYYLEPDSNSWVVWDGAAYDQKNPQVADKKGNFSLFLPPGKYYLEVRAEGHKPTISNSFNLSQPTPILASLIMKAKRTLNLGPLHIAWPDFSVQKIDLQPAAAKLPKNLGQNSLAGKTAPNFSLINTSNQTIRAVDLLGRPTVLTFLNTWAPSTSEQLAILAKLQTNKDINVQPIALQESASKLNAYNQIAGYQINWLGDPDSTLSGAFDTPTLPTHYFIDRGGTVQKVISGVLSNQEILDNLSGL